MLVRKTMRMMLVPLLTAVLIFILQPVVMSQQVTESGTSIVAVGNGFLNVKDTDDWGAGFKVGGLLRVDEDKGLWVRTLYQRFTIGPGKVQSVEVTPVLQFYVGKKWIFYAHGGLVQYFDGENSGVDGTGGFGLNRRFWTAGADAITGVPPSLDAFGEFAVYDANSEGGTGSYIQVNLGLKFNFGKK